MRTAVSLLPLLLAATACGGSASEPDPQASDQQQAQAQGGDQTPDGETRTPVADLPPGTPPFETEEVGTLDEPWAMTFLPDGRMLVTQKAGTLVVVTREGEVSAPIEGTPEVDYGGQGGLGDVILSPDFEESGTIYLTYAEAGEGDTRGAAMGRGRLDLDTMTLTGFEKIWEQSPKVTGRGHYSHRMAFSPDGQYLFVTSGERQKFDPAQDLSANLGAVLRLNPDGTAAEGNPWADEGSPADQRWTMGNRNLLGLAYDQDGTLWEVEMGPKGGDEFQRVEEGENYGYPTVSNGDHYDGRDIPDHDTQPQFRAPDEFWNPVISPSSLVIYSGEAFPDWEGDALITGLSSQALIRVTFECELNGREICEAERFDMGTRLREVEQDPEDGTLWILEDGPEGDGGRLLHLVPRG